VGCTRLFAAEKDAARGREASSGTIGGGCCSERRSRSSGRRRKLRWPETTHLFAAEKIGRVDRRLVPAPVGVAVARRGAPDPVVAGKD